MTATAEAARSAGQYVLMLSCPDTPGIVYAVAGFLVDRQCTIVQSQQFDDPDSRTFFMRVQFTHVDGEALSVPDLRHDFEQVASRFGMTWRLGDAAARQRVLIMVSKFGHCLNDLLYRNSVGELNIDIAGVVSNHPDLAMLADNYSVPFTHIPVTPDTKPEAEARLMEIVETEQVDLVVLARYMQILSEDLCKRLEGRAINIHHSMLPSFKGARPYQQAYDRGVKVVGATAHYVTADLDEGPIIEQQIMRVDHSISADEFVARGRETECRALARAVRWHTENRVALNGHKTVVLH
ncbi:formyltetrahydrofolate deformylase [Nonomuraea glycinis]|uniref:Formyltetrahydrofolate deformylase n=1 Tax=Nonomuraea glycinis TaxID=2047744 RepID=A0A918A9V5_9ACTN|nr:formyltetrahydrofolate deformylase [Nonomuraea glycinis]MCA2180861.1 formyltetrahydrofolate deformylase [Nonomuraea glycinis]GGP12897.1 formyltetrahydrofolate deformylase [Nonomuraea glycinis]